MMSFSCDLAQRPTMDKEFRGGGGGGVRVCVCVCMCAHARICTCIHVM